MGQGNGVEEWDKPHLTVNVKNHLGECFRILATWQHTFTQKVTHRDRGDDYKPHVQTRFA